MTGPLWLYQVECHLRALRRDRFGGWGPVIAIPYAYQSEIIVLDLRINTLKPSANQLHLFQDRSKIVKGVKSGSAAHGSIAP